MRSLIAPVTLISVLASGPAAAGGIMLYEVGTADLGLASAGYNARAQDASTVLTNPAGLTRLDGNQILLGAQVLYGNVRFSIGEGTSPELGSGSGGHPVGWFPGGGTFISYSASPDLKLGLAITGNFGLAEKYDSGWVGRYYIQESALLGISFLPTVAYRVSDKLSVGASLNAMYGILSDKTAINNIIGPDGQLKADDKVWGFGANVGLLYELDPRTRFGITYNSQIDLDFTAKPEFSGLSPGIEALLRSRGLLDANIGLGMKVPQGVMGSVFTQVDDRWALLGSVGWQQWSRFGKVQVSIDSSNPVSLTTNIPYKDTWHVAGGAQYRMDNAWLLNFGVAYDSAFQGDTVPVTLPANAAWRFGVGVQQQTTQSFNWGVAAEYAYGGTLDVNQQGNPVILGGRGNVVGNFPQTGILFLGANFAWKF